MTGPRSAWLLGLLGRLLPREVRERVFDPAVADLVYDHLTTSSPRRLPLLVRGVGTYVGCVPVAIPRLFFLPNGRLTRLGRLTIVVLALMAALTYVRHEVYGA